jgi:hypothetical protein
MIMKLCLIIGLGSLVLRKGWIAVVAQCYGSIGHQAFQHLAASVQWANHLGRPTRRALISDYLITPPYWIGSQALLASMPLGPWLTFPLHPLCFANRSLFAIFLHFVVLLLHLGQCPNLKCCPQELRSISTTTNKTGSPWGDCVIELLSGCFPERQPLAFPSFWALM